MIVRFYLLTALPIFLPRSVKLALAIAAHSPDTFPAHFGAVAETPHIEGVRGVRAFVLVTCVV
jgi:hypothetical protein